MSAAEFMTGEFIYNETIVVGTNLVGKFTQSVRRIVQDVKDEGTASGLSKEEVIETNERLRAVRVKLEESYDTAKKALNSLMGKYTESKVTRNVFQRYQQLKAMIKVNSILLVSKSNNFFLGGDSVGNAVLGVGGNPATGEAGDCAVVCPQGLLDYGENAQVWGGG